VTGVCLLVVASRLDPLAPLIVAANRDERLDRPATAATVLQAQAPRIVGGRDDEAGGTWLAVNEHGLVAGLTNRPSQQGRDPSKRSRGELPLALARHPNAEDAVEDLLQRFRPDDYNPSWLLVGDRTSLLYVDMTGGERPEVRALPPGIHILENNPIDAGSAKQRHVMAMLRSTELGRGGFEPAGQDLADLEPGRLAPERLRSVLADHSIPADHDELPDGVGEAVLAACVHTERYGTRSAALIRVLAGEGALPEVAVADGHPCTAPLRDVGALWRA
jgi:uncharacterized protein with NRDE domain